MIEVIREFFHRFCGGRRPTRAVQREGDLTPVTPFDNGAGVGLFREEHSKEVPLPLPVVVSAAPKPPEKYEIWSPVPRAFLSAGSGASYFFLGVAGGSEVLSYDNGIPWYVYAINVFAGIGYALANYVGFGYAVSKDSSVKGAAYKVFCTLGALTFYTGGVAAGQILGFPFVATEISAVLSFALRAYLCARSAALCAAELKVWQQHLQNWNHQEPLTRHRARAALARVSFIGSLVATVCVLSADSWFFVVPHIASHWFGVDSKSSSLRSAGIACMSLSMLSNLPFAMVWSYFAFRKLTCGLIGPDHQVIRPNRHFYAAGLLGFLAFGFPVLGFVNSPESGPVSESFGKAALSKAELIILPPYIVLASMLGAELMAKLIEQGAVSGARWVYGKSASCIRMCLNAGAKNDVPVSAATPAELPDATPAIA